MRRILWAVILVALATPSQAADFSDPDWPCIQRKVLRLSIGQMWAGAPIDPAADWQADVAVRQLAPLLAARRTDLDEAAALIDGFAGSAGDDKARRLPLLFQGAFSLIDQERSQIIDGIGRYAQKQARLSEKIEAAREELAALSASESPDLDRVEELEDMLAWDVRIYGDRAQVPDLRLRDAGDPGAARLRPGARDHEPPQVTPRKRLYSHSSSL